LSYRGQLRTRICPQVFSWNKVGKHKLQKITTKLIKNTVNLWTFKDALRVLLSTRDTLGPNLAVLRDKFLMV